jgi:hypothetical protein
MESYFVVRMEPVLNLDTCALSQMAICADVESKDVSKDMHQELRL